MNTRALLLAAPMLMMVTASFAADDYPALKPGLWSSTQTFSDPKMPVISGKMCTNDQVFKSYQDATKDPSRPCKAVSQSHVGSTYTAETECNFGGKIKHSSSVLTAAGDSAFHLEVKPDSGMGLKLDMKYLGSCPANMAPGDFVGDDGMHINVLKGTSSPAPGH